MSEWVKVTQLCLTLCDPMDYSPWNSLDQNTRVGRLSLLQGIFPGIEPRSPTLQADSLPPEPQGKPKSTGVGSWSLLQQIFPTQESNRGFLHCRKLSGKPQGSGGLIKINKDVFYIYIFLFKQYLNSIRFRYFYLTHELLKSNFLILKRTLYILFLDVLINFLP